MGELGRGNHVTRRQGGSAGLRRTKPGSQEARLEVLWAGFKVRARREVVKENNSFSKEKPLLVIYRLI